MFPSQKSSEGLNGSSMNRVRAWRGRDTASISWRADCQNTIRIMNLSKRLLNGDTASTWEIRWRFWDLLNKTVGNCSRSCSKNILSIVSTSISHFPLSASSNHLRVEALIKSTPVTLFHLKNTYPGIRNLRRSLNVCSTIWMFRVGDWSRRKFWIERIWSSHWAHLP